MLQGISELTGPIKLSIWPMAIEGVRQTWMLPSRDVRLSRGETGNKSGQNNCKLGKVL